MLLAADVLIDTKTNKSGQTLYYYTPNTIRGIQYTENSVPSSFRRVGMTPRQVVKVDEWGVCFGPNCNWAQLAGELSSTMSTSGTYPFVGYNGKAYIGKLAPNPVLISENEIPLSYDFVDPSNPSPICLPSRFGNIPTALAIISIAQLMYVFYKQNPNIASPDNLKKYPTPPTHPVRPCMRSDPNGVCALFDYMKDLVKIPLAIWTNEDIYKAGQFLGKLELGPFDSVLKQTQPGIREAFSCETNVELFSSPTAADDDPTTKLIPTSELTPYENYLVFLDDFFKYSDFYINKINERIKINKNGIFESLTGIQITGTFKIKKINQDDNTVRKCSWEPISNIVMPNLRELKTIMKSIYGIGANARTVHYQNVEIIKTLENKLKQYIIDYNDPSITVDVVLNYMKYTRMYKELYRTIMSTREILKGIEQTYFDLTFDGPYQIDCTDITNCNPNAYHDSLLTTTYLYFDTFIRQIEYQSSQNVWFDVSIATPTPESRYYNYIWQESHSSQIQDLWQITKYAVQLSHMAYSSAQSMKKASEMALRSADALQKMSVAEKAAFTAKNTLTVSEKTMLAITNAIKTVFPIILTTTPVVLSFVSPETLKDPMYQFLMGYASQAFSLFSHATGVSKSMEKIKGTEWMSLKSTTNLYAMCGVPSSFGFQSNTGLMKTIGTISQILNKKQTGQNLVQLTDQNLSGQTSLVTPADTSQNINDYIATKITNVIKSKGFGDVPINITSEKAMDLLNNNKDFGLDFLDITNTEEDQIQLGKNISYFVTKYKLS